MSPALRKMNSKDEFRSRHSETSDCKVRTLPASRIPCAVRGSDFSRKKNGPQARHLSCFPTYSKTPFFSFRPSPRPTTLLSSSYWDYFISGNLPFRHLASLGCELLR